MSRLKALILTHTEIRYSTKSRSRCCIQILTHCIAMMVTPHKGANKMEHHILSCSTASTVAKLWEVP